MSPRSNFVCGSMRSRGLLDFLRIDVRVHKVLGSPRPSFKVMYGSMGFWGFRDPQSNLFISPAVSGSPGTSLKFMYTSMRFQGLLGPSSN
jgi:hypothetical protein